MVCKTMKNGLLKHSEWYIEVSNREICSRAMIYQLALSGLSSLIDHSSITQFLRYQTHEIFWHFLTPILKIQQFPLGTYVDSQAKIFLILCPPLENSTTRIKIWHSQFAFKCRYHIIDWKVRYKVEIQLFNEHSDTDSEIQKRYKMTQVYDIQELGQKTVKVV